MLEDVEKMQLSASALLENEAEDRRKGMGIMTSSVVKVKVECIIGPSCVPSKRKDSDSGPGRLLFVVVGPLSCAFDAFHILGEPSEVWIDVFYHFDMWNQRHH